MTIQMLLRKQIYRNPGKEMNTQNLEGLVQHGPLIPLPFPLHPVKREGKWREGWGHAPVSTERIEDYSWSWNCLRACSRCILGCSVQFVSCLTNNSSVLRDADDLICRSHFRRCGCRCGDAMFAAHHYGLTPLFGALVCRAEEKITYIYFLMQIKGIFLQCDIWK